MKLQCFLPMGISPLPQELCVPLLYQIGENLSLILFVDFFSESGLPLPPKAESGSGIYNLNLNIFPVISVEKSPRLFVTNDKIYPFSFRHPHTLH